MNSKIIKQGLDQIASIDADVKKGLDLVGYPEPRIRPEGLKVYSQSFSGNRFLPKQPQAFGSGWMEYGAKKPPDLFCDSLKKLCGVLDFPEEKSSMPKALP